MSKANTFVFKLVHIIAWMIFVGLCIEAGGLIVNFVVSLYNPGFLPNLYQKLDLTSMHEQSTSAFVTMYSFILTIAILKAVLFYVVIHLLHKLDLAKPFNNFVSKQITLMSYFTLAIGLLSYIARELAQVFEERGFATRNLDEFWADSQAFILMAAVIYVIASIFKKGIEIQNENDLTV